MEGGSPPGKRKGKWTDKFGQHSAVAGLKEPGICTIPSLHNLILVQSHPWGKATFKGRMNQRDGSRRDKQGDTHLLGTTYCCRHLTHWFLLILTKVQVPRTAWPRSDPESLSWMCCLDTPVLKTTGLLCEPHCSASHQPCLHLESRNLSLNIPLGFFCICYQVWGAWLPQNTLVTY